jgi:hypothetical protein
MQARETALPSAAGLRFEFAVILSRAFDANLPYMTPKVLDH